MHRTHQAEDSPQATTMSGSGGWRGKVHNEAVHHPGQIDVPMWMSILTVSWLLHVTTLFRWCGNLQILYAQFTVYQKLWKSVDIYLRHSKVKSWTFFWNTMHNIRTNYFVNETMKLVWLRRQMHLWKCKRFFARSCYKNFLTNWNRIVKQEHWTTFCNSYKQLV